MWACSMWKRILNQLERPYKRGSLQLLQNCGVDVVDDGVMMCRRGFLQHLQKSWSVNLTDTMTKNKKVKPHSKIPHQERGPLSGCTQFGFELFKT